MTKIIALAFVTIAAAIGTLYATHPDEFQQYANTAAKAAERMWANIEANPVPVLVALGTFVLTIVYHKLKGKSLRESVEFAATRVTLVPVPTPAPAAVEHENENAIVKRAQARATRTQLIADQIGLENRIRKLPDEVKKAEKEVCYTEQAMDVAEAALTAAEEAMEEKIAANAEATARLEALKKELATGEAEITAIATELKKLADVV